MTNREIAQEINNRIGTAPVPFDSVYSIALQIYHELGGEENQFDSVYSILLEILPLVEGGIKPIEEVSELPEASENKDKLFRLDNGEKDVYAAKLLSSETITTNRLPDEQQIDKAYLYDTDNNFVFYYKGIWKIICTNGEISLYCWVDDFENDRAYFTYDNAENINHNSETIFFGDTVYESVDGNAKTIIDGETLEDLKSHFSVHNFLNPIPAIYNAPESAQIGNATLVDENSTIQHIYTGEEIIITVDGNETVVYKWQNTEHPNEYVATDKKASEIYYTGGYPNLITDVKIYDLNISPVQQTKIYELNIPQLNAPDSEQIGNATIKYNMGGNIFTATYDGTLTTLYDSIEDVSFTGYKWTTNSNEFITIVKAEELYSNAGTFSFMWQDGSTVADAIERVTEVNTVKYQRTETTEEWGWKKVATEDDINHLSDELSTKANKVDYVVQLNPTTQQYDWASLNSVTETGTYRISIEVNMMGTVMKMGTCDLFVSNTAPTIIQSILIPGDDSISLHVRKSTNSGSSWTDSDIAVPSINDGATTSTTETYSVTKINSLISALETRIAALEGN